MKFLVEIWNGYRSVAMGALLALFLCVGWAVTYAASAPPESPPVGDSDPVLLEEVPAPEELGFVEKRIRSFCVAQGAQYEAELLERSADLDDREADLADLEEELRTREARIQEGRLIIMKMKQAFEGEVQNYERVVNTVRGHLHTLDTISVGDGEGG